MAEENKEPRRVSNTADEQVEALVNDLNVPDEYKGRTAQESVARTGFRDPLADERAKRAEEAGVVGVAYVGYEEALRSYEARPDIESLADRRARENGGSFEAAGFRRQAAPATASGVVTSQNARVVGDDEENAHQENRRTSEKNPVGEKTTDPKSEKR